MKPYISLPEMAELLGISRIAVFKKVKKGQLKAEKMGRNYFVESEYALQYAYEYNRFHELSTKQKEEIEEAVEKITSEDSEAFKL